MAESFAKFTAGPIASCANCKYGPIFCCCSISRKKLPLPIWNFSLTPNCCNGNGASAEHSLSRSHKGAHTHTYTNTHSFLFSLLLFVIFRSTPLFYVIHKCNFAFAIFDSQAGCCCNRQMIIIESSQLKFFLFMFMFMQHAMLL